FEKLIHGPESPRKDDKPLGIFNKHDLPDEEIIKSNQFVLINIGVVKLLKRKVDIQTYRFAIFGMGALVACLHDPRPPSSNDTIAMSYQLCGNFLRHFIIMVIPRGPRRSKYRYTRADFCQLLKPI